MIFQNYSWFDFVVKKIDYKKFYNLENIISKIPKNINEDSKSYIGDNTYINLNKILCNAYMSLYIKNSFKDCKYDIIEINKYKTIKISACLNYVSDKFKILKVNFVYRNINFIVYLIYDASTSADNLSTVDNIVIYIENIDLIEEKIPISEENLLVFRLNTGIVLKVDKTNFYVVDCHSIFPYTSLPNNKLNTKDISTLENEKNKITKLKLNINSLFIMNEELNYLKKILISPSLNVNTIQNEFLHLFNTPEKRKLNLDVYIFEIIDIVLIHNDLLVVRTSYIENTKQLIFIFKLETDYIKSYIFYILNIYPHKTIKEENYEIENVIESASRLKVSSKSSVTTKYSNDILIITENISVKYEKYNIKFSDTIVVEDIPSKSTKYSDKTTKNLDKTKKSSKTNKSLNRDLQKNSIKSISINKLYFD